MLKEAGVAQEQMDPQFVKGIAVGAAGAALVGGITALALRQGKAGGSSSAGSSDVSTTSSSHGQAVYETSKAVAEYLMFHFGAPRDILPYDNGPTNALDFAGRCVS
jgi:hypothetical protein